MFDRRPNRLGYAVIAAVVAVATVAASGAALALGRVVLGATSALAARLFWTLLVPAVVVADGILTALVGVRAEYYLVVVLLLGAAFLAFLVLFLPGMADGGEPEFSRRR